MFGMGGRGFEEVLLRKIGRVVHFSPKKAKADQDSRSWSSLLPIPADTWRLPARWKSLIATGRWKTMTCKARKSRGMSRTQSTSQWQGVKLNAADRVFQQPVTERSEHPW